MQIVEGSVVRATAGRDKGGFFAVIGFDGACALLSDGRRRKLETPKKRSSYTLLRPLP